MLGTSTCECVRERDAHTPRGHHEREQGPGRQPLLTAARPRPVQDSLGGKQPHRDDRPHQPSKQRLRGVPEHPDLRRPGQEHQDPGEGPLLCAPRICPSGPRFKPPD